MSRDLHPTARELLEMQYQLDEPFVVDSSKVADALGARATPVDRALPDTLATYRPLAHSAYTRPDPSVGTDQMAEVHPPR